MQIVIGLLLSLLLQNADGKVWQPNSPLHHGVMLKDFVNSRSLPITSPSGTSAGRTTTSAILVSDDVARGGHANVKIARDEEETETVEDFVDTIAKDATATPQVEEQPNNDKVKAISVDHTTDNDHVKGRKKKATSSASRSSKIAKKLKNRNHLNLQRKGIHATLGLFFAAVNYVVPKKTFVPVMIGVSSLALVIELLRYRKEFQWLNDIVFYIAGKGLRKHEMEGKFSGIFYFVFGVTLSAALYSKPCSTLGIIQLALADPSASYFGTKTKHVYWSRIENGFGGFGRNKGILGFLGGALFCVPFNYRLLSLAKFASPPARATLALASLAFGLAGAFADLAVPTPVLTLPKRIFGRRVPPFHVDDNFVVPVFSGFACTQVFKVLSWSQELEFAKYLWF